MNINSIKKKNYLEWIKILFFERLGVNFEINFEKNNIVFKLKYSEKKVVFKNLKEDFYIKDKSLTFFNWYPEKENFNPIIENFIPALGMESKIYPMFNETKGNMEVSYDILGFIFNQLNRIEEFDEKNLDKHSRFLAKNSMSSKNNYLNRPIVDEWMMVLSQVFKRIWPNLNFKKNYFYISVSHDVDRVSRYETQKNFFLYLRVLLGDLYRFNFRNILLSPFSYFNKKKSFSKFDPFNTFDWLMDLSEENNIKSTFNFIFGKSHKFNPDYDINDNKVLDLIKKINERGHLIGLHPSYDCYNRPNLIKKEFDKFIQILNYKNIHQKKVFSRMHYLRWKSPETLIYLNDSKINVDNSMLFVDHAGFRCGTCHSYPGYDILNNKILNIRVEPLILMDVTLFDYMKLNNKAALNFALDLKNKCKMVEGNFSFLWHNSFLDTDHKKKFYKKLIEN